jgi:DNA ligase D-like protein (predicted 3'-phosphoesterase)
MFKTTFSIQHHKQKKNNSNHFDLRVVNRNRSALWSWAIPKSRFPEKKEKLLAIRTSDHKMSYMYFQGKLKNGDRVSIYDKGECEVIADRENLMIINFKGASVIGSYTFIKMKVSKNNQQSWLIMKTKNK